MREAKKNELYVCSMCGKTAKSIYNFDDVYCAEHSRLVYESHIQFVEGTTIANCVEPGGIVPNQPKIGEDE